MVTLTEIYGAAIASPMEQRIREEGGVVIHHLKGSPTPGIEVSDYSSVYLSQTDTPTGRKTPDGEEITVGATVLFAHTHELKVMDVAGPAQKDIAEATLLSEGYRLLPTGFESKVQVGVRQRRLASVTAPVAN